MDKQKEFEQRVNCGIAYCEDTPSKQKQIEEMAKIMCSPCPDGKECSGSWCYKRVLDCADEIHNAGYRNCKDKVVLSREEYEMLMKNKGLEHIQEFQEINGKLCLVKDKLVLKEYPPDVVEFIKNQASKETAEKILKEVADCMRSFEDDDDGYLLKKGEFNYFMNEIAKQFGVEIKE